MLKRLIPAEVPLGLFFAIALSFAQQLANAQPPLMTGDEEEVTSDGLYRVDTSVMDSAWALPNLDLSTFTSLYFTPAVVTFPEESLQREDAYSASNNAVFFISETEQNRLSRIFGTTFYERLLKTESFELSPEVGRDVLMIRAMFLEVATGVEPIAPGSPPSTVDIVWEGALVLELRDSLSSEVLARTSEIVSAPGPVDLDAIWIRTELEVERWVEILMSRLEELRQL